MGKYKNECGVLEPYFDDQSAIHTIFDIIRAAVKDGHKKKISGDLIERAKGEIEIKTGSIDASTFRFSHHLTRRESKNNPRLILLMEGEFTGPNKRLESIVACDLGTKYHPASKKGIKETIDEQITCKHLDEYLYDNKAVLRSQGYDSFTVHTSRFFYLDENELVIKGFLSTKGFNLISLVPYLTKTKYVGLEEVPKVELQEFIERSPTHDSHRLKKSSLLLKALTKSCSTEPIISYKDRGAEGTRPITDWSAYRLVVNNIKKVYELSNFFENTDKIGNSTIEHITTRDYYEEPKKKAPKNKKKTEDEEYKAVHILLKVKTPGYEASIREIQIVDKKQYYINEIKGGPGGHKRNKEKYRQIPHERRKICDSYEYNELKKIFGPDKITRPIPEHEI